MKNASILELVQEDQIGGEKMNKKEIIDNFINDVESYLIAVIDSDKRNYSNEPYYEGIRDAIDAMRKVAGE